MAADDVVLPRAVYIQVLEGARNARDLTAWVRRLELSIQRIDAPGLVTDQVQKAMEEVSRHRVEVSRLIRILEEADGAKPPGGEKKA